MILVLILSACSIKEEHKLDQNEELMCFLYVTPLVDHSIWLQSKKGFDQACKELEVKCEWIGPSNIDKEGMEEAVYHGILQKYDGIITSGDVSLDILKQAAYANIPVVLVDSDLSGAPKLAYFGKDFTKQAELMLEELEASLGKNTLFQIGIQVSKIESKVAEEQITAIDAVFKRHPGGHEIMAVSESKSDMNFARSEWNKVLHKYPEINVSLNLAAESAIVCGEVAQKLGKKNKLFVFGVDDMDTTIEYIKKDIVDASVVTSFFDYGYLPLYQLVDYLKFGDIPEQKNNKVKTIVVNRKNVETYKEEFE